MSHNTWIHKIARATIVRPLAKTAVTPNQVTTVRIIAGIAAAGALAVGDASWSIVGGWLFMLSMLLDRADGDLAGHDVRDELLVLAPDLVEQLLRLGVGEHLGHVVLDDLGEVGGDDGAGVDDRPFPVGRLVAKIAGKELFSTRLGEEQRMPQVLVILTVLLLNVAVALSELG